MTTFNIIMLIFIAASLGGIFWVKHSKHFKKNHRDRKAH